MPEPIRHNAAVGDIRPLWDRPRKLRLKNQGTVASDGTALQNTLLYYIAGLTTFCGLRHVPVITGYMSGCYLFRYRRNGDMRVAHVGTHDANAELSTRAKDAWKAYAAQPHITEIYGFDPIRDVSDNLMRTTIGQGPDPKIFGAWDPNGIAYIGMSVDDPAIPGNRLVTGVEPAPMRSWAMIAHDTKMQ
ncbi:hypothetical protein AB3Y40_09355 [Yoonia sp. R2331]|uniref:hypothetical protein n=1 Tax=Yoonia sp. R2331 TaxID=3237238 RepID=UPI0034E40274